MRNPHIVILGAGYGGIISAVRLQKTLGVNEAFITLVNNHDYHYQTTWLHENAAGTRHHDQTRIPIQEIIDLRRVKFVQDTVTNIKPDAQKVKLANGELTYDILVVALGFEAAYGAPGLNKHAFTIENINSSRLLREHLEYQFAMYCNETVKTNGRLNFVVSDSGLTGTEFAGELANRIPELCREYDVDFRDVRIVMLEPSSSVMSDFDANLAEYARNSLEARGVEFITNACVNTCEADKVIYEKDGLKREIPTLTTVWTAGVRPNGVIEQSGLVSPYKQIEVRDDLRAADYDHIFVVGDCAQIWDETNAQPYPSTAHLAIQEGEMAAFNIKALIRGDPTTEFKPDFKGMIASLGHDDGVGMLFGSKMIFGFRATFMKKMIDNRYLFKLGGMGLMMKKGKFNIFH